MIHESVVDCIGQTPLVYLRRLFAQSSIDVIAKLELLNPGGSIKDRPARFIIERGLRDGSITPRTRLVESTSGNFGIALAMVAQVYNLPFTAIIDPKITSMNLRLLEQLGARIEMVHEPDDQGGYLKTRVRRALDLCASRPDTLWINQYANKLNVEAHYQTTGAEIVAALDAPIDYLVLAVSSSGTLMGVARRLREAFPRVRVVAVDAVGSIIFGAPAGPREIPGIGSSRVPELLDTTLIDTIMHVSDWEAVQGCRQLVTTEGILAGGSSGSVITAIHKLLATLSGPQRILTILPDRGERYLDTVYNDAWVVQHVAPQHTESTSITSEGDMHAIAYS